MTYEHLFKIVVFGHQDSQRRMIDWYATMQMRCGKCHTIVQEYWPNFKDIREIIYYCMCGEEE